MLRKFIPNFVIDAYHYTLSFLGAVFYGFPSRKIKVIGITGTNGKSTSVNMTSRILEEAGFKVASLSSISFKIGEKEEPNKLKMTMPGRFVIKKFISQAVKEKCDYIVIEVASEGIKQHRHRFIDFKVAGFTNLNPEHIEAHKGFENYKNEKGKFFGSVKDIHVVNMDDAHSNYFLQFKAKKIITYGIYHKKVDVAAKDIVITPFGSRFKVDNVDFEIKPLCEFNIYNALLSIGIGLSQGVNLETASKALKKVEQIAGRMEQVIFQPFNVFVDYAFTPVALEKVYAFLKPEQGKLICVLGACGGGRDKWKRPVLGGIADKYGDIVIITNEDPYDEDPMQIIGDVAKGVKNQDKLFKIFDRREAIKKALSLASSNDTVVITGKGCEPWICLARGKKEAWDDRAVVCEEINNIP